MKDTVTATPDEPVAGSPRAAHAAQAASASARLHAALHEAAHYLPAQAPLEVFVHHNTLHAFQHLPFHEGVSIAQKKLGAQVYLPEERYRAALRSGRITDEDLDAALAALPPPQGEWLHDFPVGNFLRRLVLVHGIGPESPAGLTWQLDERQAASRFRSDVSTIASARILADTERWLREQLTRCTARTHVHTLIRQICGDKERRAELLGAELPDTADALWRQCHGRLTAVATSALWTACREVTKDVSLPAPAPPPPRFPREWLLTIGHEDPDELVHPVLIPLCAAFLDRGQSHWPMPERDAGFFAAWCRLCTSGMAVRPAWLAQLGKRLRTWIRAGTTAEAAVLELLTELGITPDERAPFIEQVLLRLPGWAGMFNRLESAPGPLGRSPARVALLDYLAVRLTLDAFAYRDVAARHGFAGPLCELRAFCAQKPPIAAMTPPGDHDIAWPLFQFAQLAGVSAPTLRSASAAAVAGLLTELLAFTEPVRLRVFHEAFERHYRDQVLAAISANHARIMTPSAPQLQMVFCIDDRAESLRRHLEELEKTHETFGAAGFFNLAIAYQGLDDPATFPLCPVVVQPRHRILERASSEHLHLASARVQWRRRWGRLQSRFHGASRSLLWGPVVTAAAGALAAVPLLATVFAPWISGQLRRLVSAKLLPAPRTHLHGAREPEPEGARQGSSPLFDGFTLAEKAERVATLLENIGLTRRFAPLVAIIGHDSTSVNNPHFAAYSCGACGGRSGGPNARLFAQMANRPEVRERLRERGIHIPAGTVFIGGVHDTCNDSVTLFDVESMPAERLPELEALRTALDAARRRNAHERCRRFASAPRDPSPNEALHHVEERAFDLSQARPELGHATNAACVVGRRALTRGVFLDRRPFLVSYDPLLDPDAVILERILLAVGPVGAGINLEYFFSTVDNERLGAGTKLPHNVTGLLGVMNGASSDLRTGLPKQMIEIHEPIRLQLFIETTAAALEEVLRRQPAVAELVRNEWVRVAVIDPTTGMIQTLSTEHGFRYWEPPAARPAQVRRSADWYHGHSDFIPPALLLRWPKQAGRQEPPSSLTLDAEHDF